MATFQELMEAAGRAHKAGDANAARALVQAAKQMQARSAAPQVSQPQTDTATGAPMAMQPPSLEAGALEPTPRRPDRFGDTIAAAVEDPVAATKFYAGRTMEEGRNPLQRAGDAGMTALNALGSGVAFLAGTAGELVGGSPTNERRLARDLLMGSSVAVPELAGVSATTRTASGAANAAARLDAPATEIQAGARAADTLGITPSLGMTGKTGGMVAAGLEKVPFAADVVANDAARAVGEIEGAFKRIVGSVAEPRSAAGAGDTLITSATKFRDDFKVRAGRLFQEVGQKLPPGTRVEIPNTLQAAQEARQFFANNPELARTLGLNRWDAVLNEAATNGMTWQALADFRSAVGEGIGSIKGPLADQADGRLKSLYGTLTADMEAAARSAGPEAFRSWKRATNFYRAGAERIERALDQTINAKSPERAFEAFRALASEGTSRADITRMTQIKRSMPPDEWNVVSASIVDRLGRARAGAQNAEGDAFSPSTFLTEWNKLSPQAKAILMPSEARRELEQLARVAERAKAAGAERNFSNTGTIQVLLALGIGTMTDLGMAAGALGGSYVSAKAMTSERFLRAMNRAARGDMRDMERLANSRGPFAQDAATVMRMAGSQAAATGEVANTNIRPLRAVNQPR
jgi:hypothetical protein